MKRRHYPMLEAWTVIRPSDADCVRVINEITKESFIAENGKDYTGFISALDGKTDPFDIPSCYTYDERLEILDELSQYTVLRNGRWLRKTFTEMEYALLIFHKHGGNHRIFRVLNRLLYLLFLPILVCGFMIYYESGVEINALSIPGLICGMLLGAIMHESAHACAALAYGGKVYEIGVRLSCLFMPGAYIVDSSDDHLAPEKRIQLFAAGIEMNAILAGLLFIHTALFPGLADFFFSMAGANAGLILLNLTIIGGYDGCGILSVLFNKKANIIEEAAMDSISNKRKRAFLLSKGISGRLTLYCYCVMLLVQMALPVFFLLTVLEVISWVS